MMGLNIIHGGENALRLTPWFLITQEECDFIIDLLDGILKKYKLIYFLFYNIIIKKFII